MIVSLSLLYHILIKIWAPRASWEINEHSYCYWNQHKGILCWPRSYLNNQSHGHHPLFHQPSQSNALFLFNLFSPPTLDALVLAAGSTLARGTVQGRACTRLHGVTAALPGGCAAAPSYLGLCKSWCQTQGAGKWSATGIWLHHAPVNFASRWVKYY